MRRNLNLNLDEARKMQDIKDEQISEMTGETIEPDKQVATGDEKQKSLEDLMQLPELATLRKAHDMLLKCDQDNLLRKQSAMTLGLVGLAESQVKRFMRLTSSIALIEETLFSPKVLSVLTPDSILNLYTTASKNLEASAGFVENIAKRVDFAALQADLISDKITSGEMDEVSTEDSTKASQILAKLFAQAAQEQDILEHDVIHPEQDSGPEDALDKIIKQDEGLGVYLLEDSDGELYLEFPDGTYEDFPSGLSESQLNKMFKYVTTSVEKGTMSAKRIATVVYQRSEKLLAKT